MNLSPDYRVRQGNVCERSLLTQFLVRTYQELFPRQPSFSHLGETVSKYFSPETPIWWVERVVASVPIAGLWMGNGVDQVSGELYTHIFLLYVVPEYRRQGIATHLLHLAQTRAEARGDRQIGLQVFLENQPAFNLYQGFGFRSQSVMMVKKI
jgi:GNAT superfamily N-acetyltransferase